MNYQRDEFITVIFEAAKKDKKIYFLSADFGAPALDQFRNELPDQFMHCGISEQHMIDLAVGLALDGNTVFCYAMAPFVSLRCLEQHKCGASIMNLPICTIVAGVGLGYADAGPTHYATEDLACLRSMIGANVYTASDAHISKLLAQKLVESPEFSFVRLDREPSDIFLPLVDGKQLEKGYRLFGEQQNTDLCIVTCGYMYGIIQNILLHNKIDNKVSVIDVIKNKPFPSIQEKIIGKKQILVIDEQTSYGGLSSALLEFLCDNEVNIPVKRMTLPDKHFFENGGRKSILGVAGLGEDQIYTKIKEFL